MVVVIILGQVVDCSFVMEGNIKIFASGLGRLSVDRLERAPFRMTTSKTVVSYEFEWRVKFPISIEKEH